MQEDARRRSSGRIIEVLHLSAHTRMGEQGARSPVAEVADTGEGHRDTEPVGSSDDLGIAD